MALQIVARQAKRNLYPSQVIVSEEIAANFKSRSPEIVGAMGKPLNAQTIKRYALRGISSASKKALSIKNSRGE